MFSKKPTRSIPRNRSAQSYALWAVLIIMIISYGFTLLAATDPYWLKRFNYVMFVPAPIAMLFAFLHRGKVSDVLAPILKLPSLRGLLFAIVYPLLIIFSCALIADFSGLAQVNWSALPEAIKVPTGIQLLWAFGFLFGEEYAWRGYIYPTLAKSWGRVKSAWFVGFIWAIWHGPLVYLLASQLQTFENPMMLVAVQMFVVLIFSFPFAYSFDLSKSILPPIILHFVWNWINPSILGNIYRNQPGLADGEIFYINGEGVLGACLGLIFVVWYLKSQRAHVLYTSPLNKLQIKTN